MPIGRGWERGEWGRLLNPLGEAAHAFGATVRESFWFLAGRAIFFSSERDFRVDT
jgi:hypothetical protein